MNGVNHLRSDERDTAVDILRAMALLMMVSIHYARVVPSHSQVAVYLKFFLGAAPAFFFFVFGITLSRFFQKSGDVQFRLIRLFLYIAILQTFMMEAPYSIDFFLFLWFWQVALTLVDRYARLDSAAIFAFGVIVFILLLVFSPEWMSRIFSFWGGYFPLLPWGLFVLAGILFGRSSHSPKILVFSILMIVVSVVMHLSGRGLNFESLMAQKIPMSASYFLLFTGIVLCIHWFAKRSEENFKKFIGLKKMILFFSKNLLLGTVLHYFAFRACKGIIFLLRRFFGDGWKSFEANWDYVVIIAGSIAASVFLWFLMKITLWFFDRIKQKGAFDFMKKHLDAIGLFALFLVTIMFYLGSESSYWGIIKHGVKILALLFMVYLCLEMKTRQSGKGKQRV